MSAPVFNSDCRKCRAPMPPLPAPKGRSPIDRAPFIPTGFCCDACGHYNNIQSRKGFTLAKMANQISLI